MEVLYCRHIDHSSTGIRIFFELMTFNNYISMGEQRGCNND